MTYHILFLFDDSSRKRKEDNFFGDHGAPLIKDSKVLGILSISEKKKKNFIQENNKNPNGFSFVGY
jgi:hypothetical protein